MDSHIKAKIESILTPTLTESDVSYLMQLIRKRIESLSEKEKEDFITLKFFCDWSAHTTIDRSLYAVKILSKVNSLIYDLQRVPDNNLIIEEVTKIVSFVELKKEIKKFFKKLGLKDTLTTNNDRWLNFVRCFTEIILGSPLTMPEGRIRKEFKPYLKKIQSKPLRQGVWIIGMAIVKIDKGFFEGDGKNRYGILLLCLILYLSNTTRICIPLSGSFVFGKKRSKIEKVS